MPTGPQPKPAARAAAETPLDPGCPEVIRALDLSRPALLEASAGTGKTYAIEHLVLRLLTERDLDLEGILVLTFTKKATGELKEKIRSRLASRLQAPDLPPALRERLVREAQAEGLVRADLDAGVATRLIFGMINSVVEWYRPDGPVDPALLGAEIRAVALDGLRPRP